MRSLGYAILIALSAAPLLRAETRPFDSDWRFHRGDAAGAESPGYDDAAWRRLDLPHDWSIEDLPPGEGRVGPFAPGESPSEHFTGHTLGGIGWYRQRFTIDEPGKRVAVRFDGVYMNPEIWLNGELMHTHPHGYTSFEVDLTPCLKPAGEENVLAVKVRNEGRNSRWYSGSGIYRHAWLTVTEPVHVPTWGVRVKTHEVKPGRALLGVAVPVRNPTDAAVEATVRVRLIDADGHEAAAREHTLEAPAGATAVSYQLLSLADPRLWSLEEPSLYTAEVELAVGDATDHVATTFGVRTIEFNAERGFLLNGEPVLMRGGCVHHDNGPLGAAAVDRAEERKVELLKANGYNALRTAHNPPSPTLLDACDRLGVLVIDEAFDQWRESKERNHQDYHRFFDKWSEIDLASMVRRDRNHPSVVMWSIGNEIPEQYRDPATAARLREIVLRHDDTRPVTQAICCYEDAIRRDWDNRSPPVFEPLDVAGYNYLPERYEGDHARHPERVMYGSESFPKDALAYWRPVEEHPYVVGDFVWTAMDYLGESGLAHALLSNQEGSFFMPWPWHNAWCGDLDLAGFKKPQSFYRDVVWRRRPIAMFVHEPIPAGLTEELSWWAWPNEWADWNHAGHEGEPLTVSVYSRCEAVRLELNGEVVGEQPVSEATNLTARFEVPYRAGELRAYGLVGGEVVAETALATTGEPARLRLTADRESIAADRNDLAYVRVEAVDAEGRVVPDAEVAVRFETGGAGQLAGQTSANPTAPASFQAPRCTTFHGRCLAILRPTGEAGEITLRAEADGLEPATLTVRCVQPPDALAR